MPPSFVNPFVFLIFLAKLHILYPVLRGGFKMQIVNIPCPPEMSIANLTNLTKVEKFKNFFKKGIDKGDGGVLY